MNILILTGPLYPSAGNNANQVLKLVPFLRERHSVRILSFAGNGDRSLLPAFICGVPIRWCVDDRTDILRRRFYPLLSSLSDRNGYSDALQRRLLYDEAISFHKEYPFDAVISTIEPFFCADTASRLHCAKSTLYLMDPPASISNGWSTAYRDRQMKRILASQDTVITTPFIRQALLSGVSGISEENLVSVGFPMIGKYLFERSTLSDSRIRLLFCGWLYSEIRSPKYFLDVLSRLDERFVVTFMGRECEKLTERFDIHTKAELITLPQQPYETALQAMADADIMINIGNSVPVHMPSKTLEYINTGKPFVNFYKMDDCPTLYYTKRYPLCLNLFEGDSDIETAADRFIDFCVENKGKTVDRAFIESEYADCTPEYIAQKILDALGE